jgi:hypothetical protein
MRSLKKFMTKKKPVGAPRGNQNARKHGLYSRVLDEGQKLQLDKARAVKGLDEEIAIMRVKLLTLIDKYPERIDLQMRVIATIARMVRTRFDITAGGNRSLKDAIGKVITDIAVPLGIKAFIQ